MKNVIRFATILAIGCALASMAVQAAAGETKGKSGANAAPQDVGRLTLQDDTTAKADPSAITDDLKAAIEAFQTARKDFLAKQADLKKKLGEADSREAREQIRANLNALFKNWVEQQKELRNQIRDELSEMRETLHNARDKQLEEVKGKDKGGKGRH